MRALIALVIAVVSSTAVADSLVGRVVDGTSKRPLEGALVMISGPQGLVNTLTTARDGSYRVQLVAGTYNVIFAFGGARTSGHVVVDGTASLDATLEVEGEVIVIREKLKEPVPPRVTNFKPQAAPPYSDAAVLSDAWTRAHMLLDVDEHGVVQRYKFLRRPGYDLEAIAGRVAAALTFEPARDREGKPMRAWVVWTIEWPSAWWLERIMGTRTSMPLGKDHYIPCRGSGPWASSNTQFVPWYRDCSKPDLSKAANEPWLDVARRVHAP